MKSLVLFVWIASMMSPTPPEPAEHSDTPFVVTQSYDYSLVDTPVSPATVIGEGQAVTVVSLVDSATVDRTAPLFSLPIDYDTVSRDKWSRPHHSYPAIDVTVAVGTPVFAIREGTVTAASPSDGACGGTVGLRTDIGNVLACHLSQVVVRLGDWVQSGQLIGFSGGKPGSRGAGSSSVPHVHVQITRNGRLVCPQPLLVSVLNGDEPDLSNTTRCYN